MEGSERTERSWILACKNGQRRAFEPLVRRYGPRAYRFALTIVGDAEEAKDLSQEAFIRAYVAMHRFDANRPFYPWFVTILRNVCLSHVRRRRPNVALEDAPEATEKRELTPEVRLVFEQALARLSDNDREILVLKALQGLSYAEISDVLDIPRGTVMSRLYYARKRFGELMR